MKRLLTYQNDNTKENIWLIGEDREEYIRHLDGATEQYIEQLRDMEHRCSGHTDTEDLFTELVSLNNSILKICAKFEQEMNDKSIVKNAQIVFREKTNHIVSKSYFMNRARTWPQGYPGDYKTLEGVYRNIPMSSGIGFYFDKHFLSTTLSIAVRERKETLRELLRGEMASRQSLTILDIACGSCRELFELAADIKESGAKITCIDFDSDALNFSAKRLFYAGISRQIELRKYNALRMVSHERNLKEFGMQDVIYSTGLFDYLEDDVLIRLINSLYELLNTNGKLIVSFKDRRCYRTQEYHWLVDWNAFFQRTEEDMRALFEKAEIPYIALKTLRDRSGVIIFFIATKQ